MMNKKEESDSKSSFGKKSFGRGRKRERPEFEQKIIDIARVTRVVKGGKRFSFRIVIVIGDKKGRVGVGVAKGPDMKAATEKAYADAKKNVITLSFKGNTIPYNVYKKLGSSKILLKPVAKGHGIVAGGAVRTIASLAGIKDISGKMLGAKSKLNNARATIDALKQFAVKKTREISLELEKQEKMKKEEAKKEIEKKEEDKKETKEDKGTEKK
jgi:small subunit ribosomal protein S5